MKTIKVIYTMLCVLMMTAFSFGQTIVGSAHDFSADAWNPGDEICIVCHTPHNADLTVSDAPLWNHEVTAAVFAPLYSSSTFDGGPSGQPDGISKLCLSCHDGTVALENFGGFAAGVNFMPGNALLGTDLSDDHPISFTYNTALSGTDPGLHDPSSTLSGLPGGLDIDDDMLFGVGNDELQCASCHDVHNGAGIPFLLVKSNSVSALCLTCHDK